MGFMDKLLKTVDIWLPDEQQEQYGKGKAFEQYVAGLFNLKREYFAIHEWTRDNSEKREGIFVETDANPDFVIRYKPTNEMFAVECKWRANPVKSSKINDWVIRWSRPDQIRRYQEFARKKNIPVFVMIGLSGTPAHPDFTFCVPLEVAKYPEIFPSILDKYERIPPNKPFFWKNGMLK
ncbi:MAG: hypothetical protein GYA42_06715 [Syntrophomonadaceae bacterium]|jgi:hypothetical protein|nr:hypothetical protein [Syntrophomonadaceae bacterium]